ncbi:hypothetical protein ACFLXT_01845 [Chloroflexota bacterium]
MRGGIIQTSYLDVDETAQDPVEVCYANGWTDGLPVIPPTEEKVAALVRHVNEDPERLIGTIPPCEGKATIEKLAANAVMAGCTPKMFPAVIAATEAMLDPKFNLNGVQATSHSCAPLVIVNGPIRKAIGMHWEHNVFGGGSRANAAIGRAVRLILWNLGGGVPGEIDKATQGQPGKYCFCIAENEEDNPWEPFHVERGFSVEESTVSIIALEGPHNIKAVLAPASVDGIPDTLIPFADVVASIGANNFCYWGPLLIVMGPHHANYLAQLGWKKRDIQNWLWQNARKPLSLIKRGASYHGRETGYHPYWGPWVDQKSDNSMIPVTERPEDILIVVSGAWSIPFSCCLHGFGLGGDTVTRRIPLP